VDDDFSRRVLISLDAKGYSELNDIEQHELQQELLDVIRAAALRGGFDRTQWSVQPSGDGELAVLPADATEWTVIDEVPVALTHVLAEYNDGRRGPARLRLRLAIHQGLVRRAAGGYAGHGAVTVTRLVDSAPTRQALIACPAADLVLILSPALFNEVVLQRHTRLSDKDFRKVSISNKNFQSLGWLHVPGHDVHSLRLDAPRDPEARGGADQAMSPTVISHVGEVHGDNVIGINNRFAG
jgi:hypothetical protein